MEEELDSDSESSIASADSDGEAKEAALALERVRSMPTWRAVREGRGAAKIEWGTRVIIY